VAAVEVLAEAASMAVVEVLEERVSMVVEDRRKRPPEVARWLKARTAALPMKVPTAPLPQKDLTEADMHKAPGEPKLRGDRVVMRPPKVPRAVSPRRDREATAPPRLRMAQR
jgi:hypothetical protein